MQSALLCIARFNTVQTHCTIMWITSFNTGYDYLVRLLWKLSLLSRITSVALVFMIFRAPPSSFDSKMYVNELVVAWVNQQWFGDRAAAAGVDNRKAITVDWGLENKQTVQLHFQFSRRLQFDYIYVDVCAKFFKWKLLLPEVQKKNHFNRSCVFEIVRWV